MNNIIVYFSVQNEYPLRPDRRSHQHAALQPALSPRELSGKLQFRPVHYAKHYGCGERGGAGKGR